MLTQAATRQAGNVTIVDLSGSITIPDGTALLRKTIMDLAASGQKNLLLNLAQVTYMDSAGMGELVGAFTAVRKLGGDLKLTNPQARITHLLQMTKLSSLFAIFADEQTALQSF